MGTSSLNTAVISVLQQGHVFLDHAGDEMYARPLPGVLGATLGAHYRHVLDHFLCLAEGVRTGRVNYDERRRNPQLESSVECARVVTEGLIDELGSLSREILQSECMVTFSVGYGEWGAETVASNVAREVMSCVEHAIHHYAILKLLCAEQGIRMPFEFGVAPSTLKHLKTEPVGQS